MKSGKTIGIFCLIFTILFVLAGSDPGLTEKTSVIPAARFTGYPLKQGVPPGWVLDRNAGNPTLSLKQDGEAVYLHLVSQGSSSFGIKKKQSGLISVSILI